MAVDNLRETVGVDGVDGGVDHTSQFHYIKDTHVPKPDTGSPVDPAPASGHGAFASRLGSTRSYKLLTQSHDLAMRPLSFELPGV